VAAAKTLIKFAHTVLCWKVYAAFVPCHQISFHCLDNTRMWTGEFQLLFFPSRPGL